MRSLITGIAGFAGNYLANLLLSKGLEVYGVSQEREFRPFLPFNPAAIQYTSLDLLQEADLKDLIDRIRPALIFHLAAISSPAESKKRPRETYEVNFGGALNLLEAIRLTGIQCRCLLVSSSHVYGSQAKDGGRPFSEIDSLHPESPYAASKAAAELLAVQYWKTYGIEAVIARAFNHTGAGQGPGFVCPDLARKIVEIEDGHGPDTLRVTGLNHQIDFSDVRDVVQGYYSALTKGASGEVYNLCSGKATSIRTIAETLASFSQKAIEVSSADNPAVEIGGAMIGDNTRSQNELGWRPSIPLAETLAGVFERCRSNHAAAQG